MNKIQAINSQAENRWVPLKSFCERTNMKIRTARFYVSTGKLKIKPKDKKNDRVFIDWHAWNSK
ncbi:MULTISPECIES: hypothetical protein [Providencia]|uniref:hypothetical protein n=1 Tax=Providencia TaxID=586 RepID=UPI00065E8084|nr:MULTISPECIES: hypothetical protein [Providencia]MTC70001.1 hypothetical protein [Providencia sp. wls1914]QPE16345.1 hypothetical protein IMQ36_14375 [Providencia rettgeri]